MTDLTNEELSKKFKSKFDMANCAIDIAEKAIEEKKIKPICEVLEQVKQLPDIE